MLEMYLKGVSVDDFYSFMVVKSGYVFVFGYYLIVFLTLCMIKEFIIFSSNVQFIPTDFTLVEIDDVPAQL